MTPARKSLHDRIKALGRNYKEVSLAIDQNETYVQQFCVYGNPEKLPEDIRAALASQLDMSEALLGGREQALKSVVPLEDDGLFAITERDVRGRAGSSGIGPRNETLQISPEGGGLSYAPATGKSFFFPEEYARKVLGLVAGKADVLAIEGHSMDDGGRYALLDGDRVIIDLNATDIRQGAIFAVWDGDGVIIKQIEVLRGAKQPTLLCTSLNPKYKPFELPITDSVHIIGRVVAKIARM